MKIQPESRGSASPFSRGEAEDLWGELLSAKHGGEIASWSIDLRDNFGLYSRALRYLLYRYEGHLTIAAGGFDGVNQSAAELEKIAGAVARLLATVVPYYGPGEDPHIRHGRLHNAPEWLQSEREVLAALDTGTKLAGVLWGASFARVLPYAVRVAATWGKVDDFAALLLTVPDLLAATTRPAPPRPLFWPVRATARLAMPLPEIFAGGIPDLEGETELRDAVDTLPDTFAWLAQPWLSKGEALALLAHLPGEPVRPREILARCLHLANLQHLGHLDALTRGKGYGAESLDNLQTLTARLLATGRALDDTTAPAKGWDLGKPWPYWTEGDNRLARALRGQWMYTYALTTTGEAIAELHAWLEVEGVIEHTSGGERPEGQRGAEPAGAWILPG